MHLKCSVFFLDNLAVMKSTITFPFFRWQRGKKELIATAQAISTNSKSPMIGSEKTILPKIEKILIKAATTKTKPPNIAKYLDVRFNTHPNLFCVYIL